MFFISFSFYFFHFSFSGVFFNCKISSELSNFGIFKFLQYWKYNQFVQDHSGKTASTPVIVQGCYTWTSTTQKEIGCYAMLDQPGLNMHQAKVCFCNQDFCNTEVKMNPLVPHVEKMYTCVHSASNGTCQGIFC